MLNFTSLDFNHGETIDMLRSTIQQFAAAEIAPRAEAIDRTNGFPEDLWRKMGDLGLLGLTVEEDYGGTGLGYLAHVIAMEEISRASASVGLSYGAHSNLCVNQIRRNGTRSTEAAISAQAHFRRACGRAGDERARCRFRCRLHAPTRGSQRRALCPERNKMWITNGPDADVLVVYAKTDPSGPKGITAFLVEKGMHGFSDGAETRQARHARLEHLRTGVRRLRGAG